MRPAASLPRLITTTSALIAGMVLLLPPLIHLFLGWHHVSKQLHTELHIHTIFLNKFISTNPTIWHAQGIRLQTVLEEIHTPQTSVHVYYLNPGQETKPAVAMVEPLPWPSVSHEEALYDFGEKTGMVQVTVSLRPILIWLLMTCFLSFVLGLMVYYPLRNLSLRTMQQAMAALEEAKVLAEEANRTKSHFFANMSHELRTPMNAVIGLTELALQQELAPRVRDYLLKVATSSHSLMRLINDILDFSKIEAGKLEMETVDFHLEEIFDHLRDLFQSAVEEKGLELIMPHSEECRLVLTGDPLRLEQILSNLLSNAIKFTPRGRIEVAVRNLAPESDPVGGRMELEFSVQDSGIGLSAEQIGKLFQPFAQADGSTTRRFGGTGLGLTICNRLVKMMQGTIRVTSVPGQGSTFFFTVRLTVPDHGVVAVPRLSERLEATASLHAIAGARVLVVEDNAINRQIAREILMGIGLVVEEADNGLESLLRLAEGPFDLVLMDIQMPEMDGYSATRQIRSDPAHASLPIIAMTAHAMVEERARCLAAGMNDHVAKPVNRQQLFAALLRWIPPRQGQPATTSAISPPQPPPSAPEWHIPGIDMEAALDRMNNNRKLLRSLLEEFRRDYADAGQQIHQSLAGQERENAIRQVHTIKGMAGNLSARGLFGAAQRLEAGLRVGEQNGLPVLLKAFERELQQPLTALAQVGPDVPVSIPPTEPALEREQLTPLLQEMSGLLETQDFNALARMATLQPLLEHPRTRETCQEMTACLERFDFTGARRALTTLAENLDIPPGSLKPSTPPG
ncbi:MAG: response regulator [Magnetococcales bacterium]|nr:response regulator [Magnetococcales bacterium]